VAIDQREALIAAVRAQVEKEKAAKAEKLKKEQEAMQLAGKKPTTTSTDSNKPKYKTLSAEDLAKIEEKKRRKKAAELGIELDEPKEESAELKSVAEEPKEAEAPKAEPKKAEAAKEEPKKAVEAKEEPKKAEAKEEPKKVEASKEEPKKTEATKQDTVKFTAKTETAPQEKKEPEGLGMSVGIQPDKSGKSLNSGLGIKTEKTDDKKSGLGLNLGLGGNKEQKAEAPKTETNKPSSGGIKFTVKGADDAKKEDTKPAKEEPKKPEQKPYQKPAFNAEKAKLQPTKLEGGASSVKIIGDDKEDADDAVIFTKDGNTTIISDSVQWQETDVVKTQNKSQDGDDIISIVPNRKTPTNDVKSMYDIDDEDDVLGAEISKLAGYEGATNPKSDDKKETVEDAAKKAEAEAAKRAEAEAKKKADIEETRKKAMAEEAKKKAEAEAAKKAAALEEAAKKAEAQKKRMMEAERRAEEQQRRIAEAAAKAKAEEAARKRAEEEARKKAEEEARKKAAEEARKKAAEEARKKAEEEARAKAKEEALKVAEEARKKAEEATKILEAAKKAEAEAAKLAEENRKKAEEARKKAEEEEARKKAEAEAKAKAEAEAKAKAEAEAKAKAEAEAKAKAEAEARKKAEEEARKKAEEEAKKAAEEARKKAEEAMRILEEAKKAEEAALKAAEENRKKAEEAAKKAAEEEAKAKAEEEARKKAEEEARKKAEAEAKAKAEAEAKKAAAEALAKKAEEEANRKANEAAKKAEEEARKKAEEARKLLEEAKKAEEAALKAVKDADTMKLDLTQPSTDGKLPMAAYYLEKYTGVDSIATNVINTFNAIAKAPQESRNVVLLGEHGFGLTSVGEDFARSFYDMGICKAKTIAKIKAAALNKVKLADAMVKLAGGCLVVENAGLITADRLKELMSLTATNKNDVVVILTGEEGSINRLFDSSKDEAGKFVHKIKISGLGNADMIAIAKGYISQRGFKAEDSIDGTIRSLLMAMESGNVDRMLKAIDDAMLKCEDREQAKSLSGKKYLLAEDFK